MVKVIRVSMQDAINQLPQLAASVWHGDRVVIMKDGVPYLDLVPHVVQDKPRRPGRLKGKLVVSDDFDATTEDIISDFEGPL